MPFAIRIKHYTSFCKRARDGTCAQWPAIRAHIVRYSGMLIIVLLMYYVLAVCGVLTYLLPLLSALGHQIIVYLGRRS